MRIGAGPKPSLRYLVMGAVVGASLFTVGKQLLAWYLSTAAVVSAYGAAGSLVVLLMWIYFSSAILLFSASCAQALEDALHSGPRRPAALARWAAMRVEKCEVVTMTGTRPATCSRDASPARARRR